MPSVEMRRSTRVFVPKAKDGELVRVLRSGRRLWVESAEVKHRGGKNGDDWYPLINDSSEKCKKDKINGWHNNVHVDDSGVGVGDSMDIDVEKPVSEISERVVSLREESDSVIERSECKMFKYVYRRKRKRLNMRRCEGCDGKKFGLHFVRRQRRRVGQIGQVSYVEKGRDDEVRQGCVVDDDRGLLTVAVESSCVGCCIISSMLSSLLRYIGRDKIGLYKLSTFLLSRPIFPVFASSGIHILWNLSAIKASGLCKIFGVRQFITMFTVNYMAAPQCFLHLHATMLFRSMRLSSLCWINFHTKIESTDEPLQYINDQSESSLVSLVTPAITDDLMDVKSVNSSPGAAKSSNRNGQTRIGVLTRSASKRRRRSLRSRRARNPLHFVLQKSSGSPIPANRVGLKKNSAALPKQELRRSVRKNLASEIPVQNSNSNSNSLGVNVGIDSQSCFANILVVETDKCYRVDGAEVVLDASSSNEWLLAVRKDGSTRYHFKVQKEMRPGTTNRYTHAVIWAGENGWKLEFPERKDWAVFKELYKVCGERNIVPTSPVVKIIPVPNVCEVTYLWDSPGAFKRPESYIKMTSDELSRTLASRTANYDMDSEDEEWLSMFNSELDDASNYVSDESFELMIDAFEKASYCNSEAVNNERAASSLCLEIANTEVAEQIHRYWVKKRKQKRSPLNRVFQLNQSTRAQLITKPVLRKKRSLKRPYVQPMQQGRGKDCTVLQVIAAEHNAAEEQTAYFRVQEAKASADKSVEVAILKRQRAQFLMENADLAMYRATMALRIADAAAESLDHQQVADHFLDGKITEV